MTRGQKSSERKACYTAFSCSFVLAALGIWAKSDLTAVAALIVAVNAPLMWYAGARTIYKCKHGEDNEKN